MADYYVPTGGLPPQTALTTGDSGRAVFTEAYAVLPRGTMSDITTNRLPFWDATRFWTVARPLTGFAETFSQYVAEVSPGGGSDRPETDPGAESVLFVVGGELVLTLGGGAPGVAVGFGAARAAARETHELRPGSYVFLPPGATWTLHNRSETVASLQWIRKRYLAVDGLDAPEAFVTHEDAVPAQPMPDTEDRWSTQRFVDPDDVRHDLHVNLVTFEPGGVIPFPETHVMEHGLYVLEGKAVYLLNRDWVEVQAGDFLWLRAFCPQACYAGGPGRFRYLLYKDMHRHARFL